MRSRITTLFLSTTLTLFAGVFLAFADGRGSDAAHSDPSQWTGSDIFQILNNSPWAKTLKMNFYDQGPGIGSQNTGGSNSNNSQMPGSMGRRGMGAGRSTGTYSSGGGSSAPRGDSKASPTEVTIQWQSALVVRMAAAKKAGEPVDARAFKPLDDYVIALIGLPLSAVGGRAASADAGDTQTAEETQRIEEHLKSSASLLRSGQHGALSPTKVELDQGKDGRMLLHFSKSDPILATEKSVEFHLDMGRTQVRKKFPLKEMEYQGKLEL